MNRVAPTTARSARPSSGLCSYGCKVSLFATNLVNDSESTGSQAAMQRRDSSS